MDIREQLDTLPPTPGVYLFKDKSGHILYIGKAKLLRNRVRSYFQAGAELDPSKRQMVEKISNIETITTDTENEALILEANLIRQHQPPYNVVLRDDKYYLFIKITVNEKIPRVFLTRRLKKDGARYFGPYSSARAVRSTLRLLRRIFPARDERDKPNDIIFPHPLFAEQDKEKIYRQNINNIIRFLKGDRSDIISTLEKGMAEAANRELYEQAALFRDQLQAILHLEGSQKVYMARPESFDAVSIARRHRRSAANIFTVRQGKLLGKNTFLLSHRPEEQAEDILRQFLTQYYSIAQDVPNTIIIPENITDHEAVSRLINTEHPPALLIPQRGPKYQLLLMGQTNAEQLLDQEETVAESADKAKQAAQNLASAIGLKTDPLKRVEIYDISTIQGSLNTASMAVFEYGQPKPAAYRKFRLALDGDPNDFAMMQEVLRRRFKNHRSDWPAPSLIIIDGGKGQLSSASKVLKELQLDIPLISLAKKMEEIFVIGKKEPIRLPYDSPAMYLIQRMRDEAHRFTITYHRLLRSKKQQRSLLDEIPGIGPKTKKQLLNHFGSLKRIRQASPENIAKVIGPTKAKVLTDFL